jgi:hypothetical protein
VLNTKNCHAELRDDEEEEVLGVRLLEEQSLSIPLYVGQRCVHTKDLLVEQQQNVRSKVMKFRTMQ